MITKSRHVLFLLLTVFLLGTTQRAFRIREHHPKTGCDWPILAFVEVSF